MLVTLKPVLFVPDLFLFLFHVKHIALAIGEEVDLQTRLLDDLTDDVDVTHSRWGLEPALQFCSVTTQLHCCTADGP